MAKASRMAARTAKALEVAEGQLAAMAEQLDAMQKQLDRMERKVNALAKSDPKDES